MKGSPVKKPGMPCSLSSCSSRGQAKSSKLPALLLLLLPSPLLLCPPAAAAAPATCILQSAHSLSVREAGVARSGRGAISLSNSCSLTSSHAFSSSCSSCCPAAALLLLEAAAASSSSFLSAAAPRKGSASLPSIRPCLYSQHRQSRVQCWVLACHAMRHFLQGR